MSRWNRTNFVKTEVIDDKLYYHFINDYFDTCFVYNNEVQYYQLEDDDIQNPDLLSFKLYGKPDYWWIVCKINNIIDVWNDIIPGEVIVVPALADIENFYTNVRKKQKDENN